MDYDKMDDDLREFFDIIIQALYSKINTKEEIQDIIETNTFSTAEAQLKFAEWRKIDV